MNQNFRHDGIQSREVSSASVVAQKRRLSLGRALAFIAILGVLLVMAIGSYFGLGSDSLFDVALLFGVVLLLISSIALIASETLFTGGPEEPTQNKQNSFEE